MIKNQVKELFDLWQYINHLHVIMEYKSSHLHEK